ncbi:ATP-binding protein [Candidatus Omnitrophota bacterium]
MKEHILVIEDDQHFRRALIELLQEEGFRATGVEDGACAIEAAKNNFFELTLADVRLPGKMDGIETVKRIKQIYPETKSMVIIMTGYADPDVPVRAIKVGVDDYIYKPFEMEVFLHSVQRNIEVYRLEQGRLKHMKIIEQMNQELKDKQKQIQEYSKKLEQKVRERTKELEHSNQQLKATQAKLIQSAKMSAVGQLGAGVAHELNNPMGGISGYVQFMLQKVKKADFGAKEFKACKKYLKYIEKESERCKCIVENLLNFSRKSQTPLGTIDLTHIIEDIFSLIGNQLKIHNVKVDCKFAPGLKKVKGHANQLQQVFTNIILNAQQAMPKGGKLKITAKNLKAKQAKQPDKISIEFSDTGCGISQKDLDKVFEPFYTTKAQFKGTGLGLSVSYQIIQAHNGEIEVKSKPGQGTSFTITLPAI